MLRFYAIGPWLLIPLGLVGLVFFAPPSPRRRDYLVWAAFVPGYAVGVAAFFIAERYRLPLLVPLCIGAGAAIDGRRAVRSTPGALDARRTRDGLRRPFRARQLAARASRRPMGRRTAAGGAPGHDRPATTRPSSGSRRSRPTRRGAGVAEYGVGVQLLAAKQVARAVPHLRRAFEAGLSQSGYDLAVALEKSGDLPAAARVIHDIRLSERDDVESLAEGGPAGDAGESAGRGRALLPAGGRHATECRRAPGCSTASTCWYSTAVTRRFPELAEAARLDPKDPESLAHLAYCEIKLGRLPEARAHAEAALALDPGHALARQVIGAIR